MVEARITSKGQITIPKQVRDRLGVGPGDSLEFAFEEDRLEVRPRRRRRIEEFRGAFSVGETRPFAEERAEAWSAATRRLTRRDGDG